MRGVVVRDFARVPGRLDTHSIPGEKKPVGALLAARLQPPQRRNRIELRGTGRGDHPDREAERD